MSTPPANTTFPEVPGWEILEKLGEGGMCAVFRARPTPGTADATGSTQERAIKVLVDDAPMAAERFAAEAELLRRIEHANVVRVHERHPGPPPYLIMDLLVGRDLHEQIERDGPMDPERAARLFADLAGGLATVHALGVRHRDIKPANVLLGDDGVPRLIDFGIARDVASPHVTRNGYVVGTAAYLPPEVFTDDDTRNAQDGARADVYALGQTLHEVLTGSTVHTTRPEGDDAGPMVRVMRQKLDAPFLDPRSEVLRIPDGLAEVVIRATRREPALRTPTALRLQEELVTWHAQRHATATPAPVSVVNRLPPAQPAASAPARITSEGATPRVAPAVAGAVGLATLGAVAAVFGGFTVVGLVLLWAYQPVAPYATSVLAVVNDHSAEIGNCPGAGGTGVIRVAVTVGAKQATRVRVVESTMEARTERCVRRILSAAPFEASATPYTIEVPVTFD